MYFWNDDFDYICPSVTNENVFDDIIFKLISYTTKMSINRKGSLAEIDDNNEGIENDDMLEPRKKNSENKSVITKLCSK